MRKVEQELKVLERIRAIVEEGPIRVTIGTEESVFDITEYVPTVDRNELVGNLDDDIQKLKDQMGEASGPFKAKA